MSVSSALLCSFELLKPLDGAQLKQHIKKGRNRRANMLNSPVCSFIRILIHDSCFFSTRLTNHFFFFTACYGLSAKLLKSIWIFCTFDPPAKYLRHVVCWSAISASPYARFPLLLVFPFSILKCSHLQCSAQHD